MISRGPPADLEVSHNQGYLGSPHNKDYSILGVYIGVLLFKEASILRRLGIVNPS